MKTQSSGEIQLASMELQRYPSTLHLEGSRLQQGDGKEFQALASLEGRHAIIEEKLDGANSGISFTPAGQLLLQSRGHYLMGGARERQFAPLHQWAAVHERWLLERLEDRYVMYGEWLFSKHSVFYDQLPGAYLHEFDIWDRHERCFLSTKRRRDLLGGGPVLQVPVLYEGEMPTDTKLLWSLVRPALGKSVNWRENFDRAVRKLGLPPELCWKQTDTSDAAEGLYVKIEDDARVLGRYKLVRHSFTQTILDSGSHHAARPIIPNQLAAGVDVYAPQPTVTWDDLGLRPLHGLQELRAFAGQSQSCLARKCCA